MTAPAAGDREPLDSERVVWEVLASRPDHQDRPADRHERCGGQFDADLDAAMLHDVVALVEDDWVAGLALETAKGVWGEHRSAIVDVPGAPKESKDAQQQAPANNR